MSNQWVYQFESQFPFAALEHAYSSPEGTLHQHDYLEIALCTEGEGFFLYENDCQNICPGDVFFLDQYFNHVAVAKSKTAIKLILLLFSANIMNTLWLNNDCHQMLERFWRSMGRSPFKISGETQQGVRLGERILEIYTIWEERPPTYQLLLDGKLKLLLAHCIQYQQQYHTGAQIENIQRKRQMEPILEYIQAHSHEKITLPLLCRMANLSETQFRLHFKDVTSLNVMDYLAQVRISKAAQLLASTDLCVKDVSLQVGFTNTNRFYAIFRSLTGLSPAQYRKKAGTFRHYAPDYFPKNLI